MSGKRIALLGLLQALGTALYVALVVTLITVITSLADEDFEDRQLAQIVVPVAFLVFFIVSACITGAMVLGYPIVLALNQRIREAFMLVAATVGWLVLMLLSVVIVIVSVRG
jgi:hypothetical protein